MENIGKEPSIIHGTFHGPGYSGANGITAAYTLPGHQKFSDDFHTFAVEWEPNVIRFYVDGLLYKTRTAADLPQGTKWVSANNAGRLRSCVPTDYTIESFGAVYGRWLEPRADSQFRYYFSRVECV